MGLPELTGRVDALEANMAYANQDLLTRPDLTAFQAFQTIWNQQISELSDLLTLVDARVKNLQNLYVNLNITVSQHYTAFQTHTGLTTGDGVHGH